MQEKLEKNVLVFNNINHNDEKSKAQAIARVPWRAAKKRRKTFLQSTQYYTTDIAQYEHINYTVQWLSSSIIHLGYKMGFENCKFCDVPHLKSPCLCSPWFKSPWFWFPWLWSCWHRSP